MHSKHGREEDLAMLRQDYAKARTEKERAEINRAAHAIMNESGKVRSMREELVKQVRNSNIEEVKDIHAFVEKHRDYQNR